MNTINHECYVSLEVAKLLKEAGFDLECRGYYDRQILRFNFVWDHNGKGASTQCSAPTIEVAQRWLREVKGYILEITAVRKNPDDVYKTYIEYWYNIFEKGKCGHFNTYEEAQELGIKRALEILKKGE